MNIYEKLQSARVELQEKALKKSGENTFAKFKYYELADFLPSINTIFKETKLFSQFVIIGDTQFGTAKLTIIDIEKPEDTLIFESPIAEAGVKGTTAIQSLGAVHTYMKRYLYVNALEIVEADALDAIAGSDKIEAEQKKVKKDDVEGIRTLELETTLYGTAYTMENVREWLTAFHKKGLAKTDQMGKLLNSEFADFKNNIMKKLATESAQRRANGTETPYDHMGTKLQ